MASTPGGGGGSKSGKKGRGGGSAVEEKPPESIAPKPKLDRVERLRKIEAGLEAQLTKTTRAFKENQVLLTKAKSTGNQSEINRLTDKKKAMAKRRNQLDARIEKLGRERRRLEQMD